MKIMRLQIRNLMAAIAVALTAMMVSCAADDIDFSSSNSGGNNNTGGSVEDTDVSTDTGYGYLSIADIMLYVDVDSEDLSNDDYMVDDVTKATRAVEADGHYLIIICRESTNSDGSITSTEIYRSTYAEVAAVPELELTVGSYTLEARSCDENDIPLVSTDPEYASIKYDFTIGSSQTTDFDDTVTCTMTNVKTSVGMSVDLLANFNLEDEEVPLTITVTFGEASYTYYYEDIVNGDLNIYYAVPVDTSTMTITLNGMYNTAAADAEPVYSEVSWTQDIEDVSSGQNRVVEINYANYNDGKIHIEFSVTTWVSGGVIGVDVMSSTFYTKGEEEIIDPDDFISDPNSAVVTLAGDLDITETYEIAPDSFDESLESYTPEYGLVITPESGASIESVKLQVVSIANSEFLSALSTAGYSSSIDLWDSESGLNEELKDYISASEYNSSVVAIDMLYAGAKVFGDYYGAYKFKLKVTDSEGRESNTLLQLNSSTLSIVWEGYDFATRYEIWTEEEYTNEQMLSVELDITSVTGITAMKIDMVSSILTDDVLSVMNLATSMDLVNPATSAMESTLKDLGFPTGDDIEGKTSMVFDISEFMPLLALLSDAGSGDETDFVITVEDASGSLTKTLMLKRR